MTDEQTLTPVAPSERPWYGRAFGLDPERPSASVRAGLLMTVIAWFFGRCVVGWLWGTTRNPFRWDDLPWARWDSFSYWQIAQKGTIFGRCGSPGFPETALIKWSQLHWCGTAGWLPGYPETIRGFLALGFPIGYAAMLASWFAMAAAIYLVWFGWCRDLSLAKSLGVMAMFTVFPGAIYNFGESPTALALALVVGAMLCASRHRFLWMTVLFTLAGLCYPSVWFAAVGLTVGIVVVAWPLGLRTVAQRCGWGLGSVVAPILLLFTYDQLTTGHFDAYFLANWNVDVTRNIGPIGELYHLLVKQNTNAQLLIGPRGGPILAYQSLFALIFVLGAVGVAAWAWKKGDGDGWVIYPALASVSVAGALLLSATPGAWPRSIVIAAPAVLVLRRLPTPVVWLLVVIGAIFSALISRYYFFGTLQ